MLSVMIVYVVISAAAFLCLIVGRRNVRAYDKSISDKYPLTEVELKRWTGKRPQFGEVRRNR